MGVTTGLLTGLSTAIATQRGHMIAWVPVCFGAGIGFYFSLRFEPDLGAWSAVAAACLVLAVLARRAPEVLSPFLVALVLMGAGAGMAAWRTHAVGEPVLQFRYYGPVEGRIVRVDRSQSDAPRILLDQVRMDLRGPTPKFVRIAMHGDLDVPDLMAGRRVMTAAHLSPPPGPAEPYGYNFRRQAWFDQIGAVGYSRTPLVMGPPGGGTPFWAGLRARVSSAITSNMAPREGAFATAIITGDRAHIPREVLDDLRAANLAHLLAISGLHMGLLTGVVFAAIRLIGAAMPYAALRAPVKKIAAVAAIGAGAMYLGLSGANIATQRAFIMVCVMFVAILLDRRALTLRSVAIAAMIVLVLRPEAVVSAGFQLSFAATTALVAVFGALRDGPEVLRKLPALVRGALAVFISSAVAGAATAPFGAAHFNQIAQYGLVANLLSVPVMGMVVAPAALVALALWPLGLGGVGLWVMKWGIAWILMIAHWVAGWDGATIAVPAPSTLVLAVIAIGGLWLCCFRGMGRWVSVAILWVGLVMWSLTPRPEVLVSDGGALIGIMTPEGRALNKRRGEGFAAGVWLENDGDSAAREVAVARWPEDQVDGTLRLFGSGDLHLAQLFGRGWRAQVADACAADVTSVIVPYKFDDPIPEGCDIRDQRSFYATGAWAIYDGVLVTAREVEGARPWAPSD
ncbi:MAG: competence protein [Rhodovulum sp.]|nr:competence protein [Rhodovulum sp.]